MNDKNLLALYGLKYNPFVPNLPTEAIWVTPETENFTHRVQAMIPQGGFALITGDPGQGKSKNLQWISHVLSAMPDITVGVMERPQFSLGHGRFDKTWFYIGDGNWQFQPSDLLSKAFNIIRFKSL